VTLLRIGYTCHDAFPSTTTNTQQIFWTTLEVARLGHQVDLRVPSIEAGPDPRASIARHYGARVEDLPERVRFVAAGRASATTTLGKAWFDLRAAWPFNRRTHDVVWTRDPLAFAVAVQWRVPAVFETYRPDYASGAAFLPWRFATIGHSRRLSWVGERRLAGVIAHSQLAADAFVRAGVSASRVLVAHNGFAPSLFEPMMTRAEARAAIGLGTTGPLAVYAGHVGPRKGTEALVALAAAVPEMQLAIVGVDTASERSWVDACVKRAGAGNVVIVPRVSVRDVSPYLCAADCLLVPPTSEPLMRYRRTVLPMKVFSYMAAGRPIVAPDLPDIREVLANDETALLVPPDDSNAAAAAVRGLLRDSARADRLGSAARTLSRRFTWEARAQKIADAFGAWIR
jgi:glycosyltransferase involved in cell wall biosynthesis